MPVCYSYINIYNRRQAVKPDSSDEKYKVTGRKSRYEHIIARTEGCLRRLRTDVIDLMLIHWPDFRRRSTNRCARSRN